jgi:hypothetical protein
VRWTPVPQKSGNVRALQLSISDVFIFYWFFQLRANDIYALYPVRLEVQLGLRKMTSGGTPAPRWGAIKVLRRKGEQELMGEDVHNASKNVYGMSASWALRMTFPESLIDMVMPIRE